MKPLYKTKANLLSYVLQILLVGEELVKLEKKKKRKQEKENKIKKPQS